MTRPWHYLSAGLVLFIITVVRRKRANPKTSYIMALMNILLNPVRYLRLGPFKSGDKIDIFGIMKDCSMTSGLTDYGNLTFIEEYKKIMDYPLYKSLSFSNLGLIMARMEFDIVASRRLAMTQYYKDVPEVQSVPIHAPVFVFGLGRSGTTFVHRLLALDPACRAPLLWELMRPVPSARGRQTSQSEHDVDRQERAEFMRKRLESRSQLGDQTMENLHEIGYDLPEECLFNMSDELPFSFHFLYTVLRKFSTFQKSTASGRIVEAYESHKRILQLLSYQTGERTDARRWMLKCPLHMCFLKELTQVFPDAKFVW